MHLNNNKLGKSWGAREQDANLPVIAVTGSRPTLHGASVAELFVETRFEDEEQQESTKSEAGQVVQICRLVGQPSQRAVVLI
jgi:hypothetical protein